MLDFYDTLTARLRASGDYVWPLALRLVMFWEFWESGITKLHGRNWFADIPWADWQKGFPWPFDIIPQNLNWLAATWGEIMFSLLVLFGLFTRFAAISLIVITAVATAAVHWPAQWSSLDVLWSGYVITAKSAGNFKLPLLFMVMLLPLVFYGGGKISFDQLLLKITGRNAGAHDRLGDATAAAVAFLVLALATVFLETSWGLSFLAMAIVTTVAPALVR
ncbi:MAG TPA: DoxX family protein [Xanthomonadales bacterium]|nr:DoxX family protein [Xanthomonadales bacterium]